MTQVISLVVPAHNEEALIGGTLDAILDAVRELREPCEIIVVDDDSTDRTAAIARERGATVVGVRHRQIAAARNAGAAAASGAVLLFVDADTRPTAAALREVIAAVGGGAVAGGAFPALMGDAPRWARGAWGLMQRLAYALGMPGGAFMFATRDAFDRAGRFDERYFAGEEIYFTRRLKRVGRFAMVRGPVVTSGRKFRILGFRGVMAQLMGVIARGPAAIRSRTHLDLWYGKHRD